MNNNRPPGGKHAPEDHDSGRPGKWSAFGQAAAGGWGPTWRFVLILLAAQAPVLIAEIAVHWH